MKASKININVDPVSRQGMLFDLPGTTSNPRFQPGPEVYRDDEEIFDQILYEAASHGGEIGIDFEFNTSNYIPTVVGISNEKMCVGLRWRKEHAQKLKDAMDMDVEFIAFSTAGADKPVLDKELDEVTPEESWGDGMMTHYLANQDFCKMPAKGEDTGDKGVMGFMNLWTATSFVSDVPQWKICRGKACEGPCPTHDVLGYCAMDAWGGLVSHNRNWERSVGKSMSPEFFREILELCECTQAMEKKGVPVQAHYVEEINNSMDSKKELLFPRKKDAFGKDTKEWEWFNPNAMQQGLDFFAGHGIRMEKADKATLKARLLKEANRRGFAGTDENPFAGLESSEDELATPLLQLYHWYLYKSEGKGLTPWFKQRYVPVTAAQRRHWKTHEVGEECGPMCLGLAHPRWIVPATSTGRLSSSSPNFQNIPARGWGDIVRAAIVPAGPGLQFLKADYSQLELRMCLYYAGVDPKDIKGDAFLWLVSQAQDSFAEAVRLLGNGMNERDVAKSVSHAGDYLEGITLLEERDLKKIRIQQMIAAGALRVYEDWHFRDGIIAFTGANLAERMFGDKTWPNRKKALEIQEDVYFKNFPMLRTEFHQKITKEIDQSRMIKSKTGRFLHLYGEPTEDAKHAAAFIGQGTSADFVQEKMLHYYREHKKGDLYALPTMQVHDEMDWEIPNDWTDKQIADFVAPMVTESKRLPGFVCPIKAKVGKNWNEGKMRTAFAGGI